MSDRPTKDPAASAPLAELVAVAERLERALSHADPHMDGSSHIPYAKHPDKPGQEMVRVPSRMMADLRTMAEALRMAWDCPARQVASDQVDALASAAADLPLVDRERGIAVIRLDPELAEELAGWSCPQWECGHPDCNMLRRAARIIGGEQP